MKNTGTWISELSSLRARGGRSLVKIAVDAVANARIGTARKRAEPGRFTVAGNIGLAYLPAEVEPGAKVVVEVLGKPVGAVVAEDTLVDPANDRIRA